MIVLTISLIILGSCANEPRVLEPKFTREGYSAEEVYDKKQRLKEQGLGKAIGVGIEISEKSCKAKIGSELSPASFIFETLVCAREKKTRLVARFQFRCKVSKEINYTPYLSNYVVSWRSAMESGKVKSSNDGIIRVATKIEDVSDFVVLKTKLFKRTISLAKGPYVVWLEQEECGVVDGKESVLNSI